MLIRRVASTRTFVIVCVIGASDAEPTEDVQMLGCWVT